MYTVVVFDGRGFRSMEVPASTYEEIEDVCYRQGFRVIIAVPMGEE